MSLLGILSKVMEVAERNYEIQSKNAIRNAEKKIYENQQKLNKAVSSGKVSRSSAKQYQHKIDEAKAKVADFSSKSHVSSKLSESPKSDKSKHVKTVAEWDREWVSIGMLKTADLSPYSHCVGLYRHLIDGKTMYVGRAIELHNGGFRKRLNDYRRESNSARTHTSGRTIHEHLDEIETMILIVGDDEDAVILTKQLEGKFISKYNPAWNKQINL